MLQLRAECIEPLQNLLKNGKFNKNEIVTCIFDTNIQFEQLDETQLLPKDVMSIVYDYFNDKITINCSYDIVYNFILFDINKIVYHYYHECNTLCVMKENFDQKDDSIMIISSSINYFNLSRLYYHYLSSDNTTFETAGEKRKVIVDNNKYTIMAGHAIYVSLILDHEILKQRINVMKQLIDIIKKN